MDTLRISYIQLEEKYKQTFLDIACFFNSYDEEYVKEILNFRGFHPEDSIQVLIDKSLITRGFLGSIHMHSLLVDLGRCIVRERLPNLKRLDLSYCKSLIEMPDVAEAQNLEWIILIGCVQLQKLNPSIGSLRKLVLLDLRNCIKLLIILSNTILGLNSLKYLDATHHHATHPWGVPGSIIPGSQIPSLFNNEFVNVDIQYLDKETLIIDPRSVPHDNNFIGVLCCLIFRLDNEQIPMDFRTDHMWLHYEDVSTNVGAFDRFCLNRIKKLLGYDRSSHTVDVKKFQYRWVNEQDLINFKMTQCANLTGRKRKISVIEENG
ncbi:hypothetical protein V8G54_027142 [Vigna mungo]|uniref:Disease resistance protein Roq1-like winged-helix domain-containing protein n=1 Tax=Vigna mungo TaxID=3915 RepID=A0AAQ3N0U8_VIGMU